VTAWRIILAAGAKILALLAVDTLGLAE
jgi:hypothetical protein